MMVTSLVDWILTVYDAATHDIKSDECIPTLHNKKYTSNPYIEQKKPTSVNKTCHTQSVT